MMFARVTLIAVLALTLIYVSVFQYLRLGHRERLMESWDGPGDPEFHIRHGMASYDRWLHRRLVPLVYILPLGAIIVVVAITNG